MTTPTPPETIPASIHDLYTFYLSPAHLEGKPPRTVTIAQAEIKMVFNSILNKDIPEVILHFTDARRSLKCNKTQTEALWDITGTDDHKRWTGSKITLTRTPTKRGGKFTIKITKPE